ncbi:fumarylacetoacetate hydrolase family protein [Sphingomonas sp.]|uniref:fumarylacetoacetate hydrolase family protein n=1 Tax=Sphingomonas sp. TaxID=28214 RepID=UPI003D6D7562
MVISGTVYGVILNDVAERAALGDAFMAAPYGRPPLSPVLYIKPRGCIAPFDATVSLAEDAATVEAAATIGLLFQRDASRVSADNALDTIGAACLALDVTVPHASYYRPPVRHRARDGFLPVGAFGLFDEGLLDRDIVTLVDGEEAHRWRGTRLATRAAELIVEISAFMTLRAGDLLLLGLPGDAPVVGPSALVRSELAGLPPVQARFAAEQAG